ncbi:dipeptidase [Steroidobacter sp.]|uniref:dipeptidase n=1 Tax=Steroidobacter sp. TaxID=1978227 RepID=UPI0039C98777
MSLVVGGALISATGPAECATNASGSIAEEWDNAIIVNALGSLDDPDPANNAHARSTLDDRVLREAHASGLTAVNITIGYVAGDEDPFERTIRDIGEWEARIRAHPGDLLKVFTTADIHAAKRSGRIGVIYGFQNAAVIGRNVPRVDLFANLGVRVIQLTYNPANEVGDGAMAPENRGLTPLGRELIARLNDRRIMVDLSHSGERTCLEAAQVSRLPISINHTGCRALADLPRNKTDDELRAVATKGGFVGVYFMPFLSVSGRPSAEDVVSHIEHAINVCGEDHVGIGTDGPVTTIDDLPAYERWLAQEVERRRTLGIGATGEGPHTLPFVIDLRGTKQFHQLADRLRKRGHSSARVEKILGRNFLSYAMEVWGA